MWCFSPHFNLFFFFWGGGVRGGVIELVFANHSSNIFFKLEKKDSGMFQLSVIFCFLNSYMHFLLNSIFLLKIMFGSENLCCVWVLYLSYLLPGKLGYSSEFWYQNWVSVLDYLQHGFKVLVWLLLICSCGIRQEERAQLIWEVKCDKIIEVSSYVGGGWCWEVG